MLFSAFLLSKNCFLFIFYCKRYNVDRVIISQLCFLKEVCLIQALRSRTDLYRLCIEV